MADKLPNLQSPRIVSPNFPSPRIASPRSLRAAPSRKQQDYGSFKYNNLGMKLGIAGEEQTWQSSAGRTYKAHSHVGRSPRKGAKSLLSGNAMASIIHTHVANGVDHSNHYVNRPPRSPRALKALVEKRYPEVEVAHNGHIVSISPKAVKAKHSPEGKETKLVDANMWRGILSKYSQDRSAKQKMKRLKSIQQMKSKSVVDALIGTQRNVRAAGMPSHRRQDHFEKLLVYKLNRVKGIDLDGDGIIDDDELEYAKELEARMLRAQSFCKQVESTGGNLWEKGWFGKVYKNLSEEDIVMRLVKDNSFEVKLGYLFGRLRTYQLTLSNEVANIVSPRGGYGNIRPGSRWNRSSRKNAEELIYQYHQQEVIERVKLLRENPLRAQPTSYREILCNVNPITGKYIFEEHGEEET